MKGFDKERPVLSLAAEGRAAAGGGISFPPVGSPPARYPTITAAGVKFTARRVFLLSQAVTYAGGA